MYCVLNMGWTPSYYANLSYKDRAFIIASVMTKIDEEKKERQKMKSKVPSARKRRR